MSRTVFARDVTPRLDTEKHFQQAVADLAKLFNWRFYHTFDSRRSARGFPDCVIAKPGILIFAELKAPDKYPTPEQDEWLTALETDGVQTYVWHPSDWDEIVNILTEGRGIPQ